MNIQQGGFIGISMGVILLLAGGILMPHFTEWDNIIFNILFILEAPWIWIYNVFLPLPNDDSDIDFLSVGQAILLFFGPFLSIALYYFIGLSLTMIYNSIQKK